MPAATEMVYVGFPIAIRSSGKRVRMRSFRNSHQSPWSESLFRRPRKAVPCMRVPSRRMVLPVRHLITMMASMFRNWRTWSIRVGSVPRSPRRNIREKGSSLLCPIPRRATAISRHTPYGVRDKYRSIVSPWCFFPESDREAWRVGTLERSTLDWTFTDRLSWGKSTFKCPGVRRGDP